MHCKHLVDSLVQDPHETIKVHMLPYRQLAWASVMVPPYPFAKPRPEL